MLAMRHEVDVGQDDQALVAGNLVEGLAQLRHRILGVAGTVCREGPPHPRRGLAEPVAVGVLADRPQQIADTRLGRRPTVVRRRLHRGFRELPELVHRSRNAPALHHPALSTRRAGPCPPTHTASIRSSSSSGANGFCRIASAPSIGAWPRMSEKSPLAPEIMMNLASRAIALTARRTSNPSAPGISRSEEHTSELQSLMRISYAVFCLKKK